MRCCCCEMLQKVRYGFARESLTRIQLMLTLLIAITSRYMFAATIVSRIDRIVRSVWLIRGIWRCRTVAGLNTATRSGGL